MGKDTRAITNKTMNKELKRLGITIDDLIEAEKKMRPGGNHYNVNWSKGLKIKGNKKRSA